MASNEMKWFFFLNEMNFLEDVFQAFSEFIFKQVFHDVNKMVTWLLHCFKISNGKV